MRKSGANKNVQHLLYSLSLCLIFWAGGPAYAQVGGVDSTGTGGRHSIKGRVVFPSGQRADVRLKIRLESPGAGDITVFSDVNGSFGFQSLRPGSYTVIIDGGDFFETAREYVFIEPATVSARRSPGTVIPLARPFTVQVYLRAKPSAPTMTGVLDATLSALPSKAVNHYRQALQASGQGNNEQAIEQLKLALQEYPNFVLALNELGVQYLKTRQLDKSAATLQTAVSTAPEAFEPRLNYGIVLLNQRKFTEAETQLREALKKNASAVTAHLYLGIALVYLRRYSEAEASLQKCVELGGTRVGQAHYYLGGLYWRAGDYKRAAESLEQYLLLEPKASNAEQIRATIKDLRVKS
ncbi:MAG TPA: tetratricopeptide repeat protein [Pyrinomonadaceae bacterium]|nr:tetratricopeptide repeat protein [Pyrinomonadaceae bacterium]